MTTPTDGGGFFSTSFFSLIQLLPKHFVFKQHLLFIFLLEAMNADEVHVRGLLAACEEQSAITIQQIDNITDAMAALPATRTGERFRELEEEVEEQERLLEVHNRLATRLRQRLARLTTPAGGVGGGAVPPVGAAQAPGPATLVPRNLPEYAQGGNIRDVAQVFERRLNAHGLSLEANWARLLPLCFPRATDATWIEKTIPADATWDDARTQVFQRFDRPGRIPELRRQLRNMQRRDGENAAAFVRRFRDLAADAEVNDADQEALDQLVDQLPTDMQIHVDSIRDSGRPEGQLVSTLTFLVLNMRSAHREEVRTHRARAPMAATTPTSARPYCAIHQFHGHATEECSKLSEMRSGMRSKAPQTSTNRVVAAGGVNKTGGRAATSYGSFNCYGCGKSGHVERNCPERKNKGKDPEVRFTEAESDKEQEDSSSELSSYTIPILINGTRVLGFLDTGASHTYMSCKLASELHLSHTPIPGRIRTADPKVHLTRLGRTEKVKIQCGMLNVRWSCELLERMRGVDMIIGRDLMERMDFGGNGLPFAFADDTGPVKDTTLDAPEPLIPDEPNAVELTEEFKAIGPD